MTTSKSNQDLHLSDEVDNVQMALNQVYQQALPQNEGRLADYIPELARVDPDCFGLALMTTQGRLYTAGDVDVPFTIQSVSKAFSYCMALELAGASAVRARVGVEPSGDAFNAIELDPVSRRPFNPMVNAGAITVAGILRDACQEKAFEAVLERLSSAAGAPLTWMKLCTAPRPVLDTAIEPLPIFCVPQACCSSRLSPHWTCISAFALFGSRLATSPSWLPRWPILVKTR